MIRQRYSLELYVDDRMIVMIHCAIHSKADIVVKGDIECLSLYTWVAEEYFSSFIQKPK